MGLGVTEAEGGVADLRTANGKRLKHLQWHTTGKNSHFELNRPYLRLNVQCFQYVLNYCSMFFPYPFRSCMCDIFGARFHCAICTDVDLCSNCESAGLPGNLHSSEGGHDSSHILIKVSWFRLSLHHPTDCYLYKIPFPLGTTQVCM